MQLSVRGISKKYDAIQALDDISLDVMGGEVHALLGENGSGKSTLVKVISGVAVPDQGTVSLDGKQLELGNPRIAAATGIATVFQELTLFPDMTVCENVFIGREPRRLGGRYDFQKMMIETAALCKDLDIHIDPQARVSDLSIAEQQLVELVKAISLQPKVLILDEATSALGPDDAQKVIHAAAKYREKGAIVLFISHRFDEVNEIADRITVLRDGRWIATDTIDKMPESRLLQLMLGLSSGNIFPPRREIANAEPVLVAENIGNHEDLNNVSLDVRRGEICGLAGLQGHGQSKLLETLFGLYPITQGEIHLNGERLVLSHNREAIRKSIAYAPSDRKTSGLHLEIPTEDNLTMAIWGKVSSLGWVHGGKKQQNVRSMIDRLRIKAGNPKSPVSTLSGGNQQKVVLGKWLSTRPQLLLLDDPTRGVDVGAKKEIYALLRELTEQGLSILVASSEIEELVGLCDRVFVMYEGSVQAVLAGEEITHDSVLAAMFGSEVANGA